MKNKSTQLFAKMLLALFVAFSIAHAQAADSFRFPLDGSWNVILDFGSDNPGWGTHLAEDVSRSGGTPVYASSDGVANLLDMQVVTKGRL
jgi:hypothetical protein